MKTDEGEVMYRGFTTGELHLNLGDLRLAEWLRRYARLRSCFVNNEEN